MPSMPSVSFLLHFLEFFFSFLHFYSYCFTLSPRVERSFSKITLGTKVRRSKSLMIGPNCNKTEDMEEPSLRLKSDAVVQSPYTPEQTHSFLVLPSVFLPPQTILEP
eukprot:TRINITY_DN5818_c0_g1_i3.p1 TRINITY_DN5818_c0_g1~~TRINITY_DN5818_c0_g1_i3.p1  ORF type:complete len:107 (+),score=0.58 TRINITY_DN5818_c0_g1_i3:861-1181(+)